MFRSFIVYIWWKGRGHQKIIMKISNYDKIQTPSKSIHFDSLMEPELKDWANSINFNKEDLTEDEIPPYHQVISPLYY